MLHIASIPNGSPSLYRELATLLTRAEVLGLLPTDIDTVTPEVLRSLLERLGDHGLLRRSLIEGLGEHPDAGMLSAANDAVSNSPLPDLEWPALRGRLGDELLARLCGVAQSSLRRYAAGVRRTPDDIADRLHTVTLIVADLRGGYNDVGIRRWFERARSRLGGRSPQEVMSSGWTPDDPEVHAVRELAAALTGSPAT